MRRSRNKDVSDNAEKLTSKNVTEPPVFTKSEIKSFKDQSCEVLNILESQGINIYADGRYGGMYLHQNKEKITNQVKKYFQSKNNEPKENNENLFSAMSKK